MENRITFFLCIFLIPLGMGFSSVDENWIVVKQKHFTFHYTQFDEQYTKEYMHIIDKGIHSVHDFFGASFKNSFDVYIHPCRQSFDSACQTDWKMPDFRSECWMVASGVAKKLDLISPKKWDTVACEHTYSDDIKTQQLITHELVHVFHGQFNASPDFSDTEGIDWFVEGLATFVSGQCDTERVSQVKKAIAENTTPASLDAFWTGKLKYGFSGTLVMYIDHYYGRTTLKKILQFNKKAGILQVLKISEPDLINNWKQYLVNHN